MKRFVRIIAPTGKLDFVFKLFIVVLIAAFINYLRDFLKNGFEAKNSFGTNYFDAAFVTLPMGTFGLMMVSHLNKLQESLYILATRDTLTDLPNRRWFIENTPEAIKPGQALLLIDIDHFKRINDTYGHDIGDDCLKQMAQHLSAVYANTHKPARIGGEEFAVFIDNAESHLIDDVAQRTSAGFSFAPDVGREIQITASVGVALIEKETTRSVAFRLADQAAYAAKARGRSCYVVMSDEPPASAAENPRITAAG